MNDAEKRVPAAGEGRRRMRYFLVFVFLLSLAAALSSCSVSAERETITGFVQSLSVDEDDNPTAVYVFDGKTEYVVKKDKKETELLDYVDRKVTATGVVSDAGQGKKTIEIESYKLVD
jgi:hypothetical protein